MPILKDTRDIKNIQLPKSGITIKLRDGVLAKDIEELEKEKSEIRQILVLFSRIIEDWDAVNGNNQKLPITTENINLLGIEDIQFIQKNLTFVNDFLAKAKMQDMK